MNLKDANASNVATRKWLGGNVAAAVDKASFAASINI